MSDANTVTLRLALAYDGSDFHGWQVQPGRATVQQAVGDALRAATGQAAVVHASGRTDAGAHALGQVAHVVLRRGMPVANLQRALNARLPASIRVLTVAEAPEGFHARRDAVGKLYRYRLYRGSICPPFLRRYVCHYPFPLDEAAMAGAAGDFVGEHDFRSFAAAPEGREPALVSTVRQLRLSALRREGAELVYEVYGNGFLRHMVRNLTGYLLAVGRRVRTRAEIPDVLAARSRRSAAATAPACGLYLVRVDYPDALIL